MTTPQVPVYGMVGRAPLSQPLRGLSALYLILFCLLLHMLFAPSQAPSSDESSNGGGSHDAPAACYVQPASPETHQPLWAHTRDPGTKWEVLHISCLSLDH